MNLFKKQRFHAALLVDEFGGTLGFVTMGDLVADLIDEGDSAGPLLSQAGSPQSYAAKPTPSRKPTPRIASIPRERSRPRYLADNKPMLKKRLACRLRKLSSQIRFDDSKQFTTILEGNWMRGSTNSWIKVAALVCGFGLAQGMGIEPRQLVIAVMFGASASFVPPIGHQTNTLVYGAGNYRFMDFVKMGVPMNIGVGIVTCFAISAMM